jgi:serine/threonine-protein kinase
VAQPNPAALLAWVQQRTSLPASFLAQAQRGPLCLGPYEVTGRLGRGGMGAVLRGRDPERGHDVALKLLQEGASDVLRARFRREAEALSKLDHPHVVRCFACEREGPLDYLVLEHVPGVTLERRIRADGPLDEEVAWTLLAQAADALACAEAEGITHRDLKPGNILWDADADHFKLLDFGIARLAASGGAQLTAAGTTLGTPAYMSPEQAMGKPLDARSDMYALGLTVHEVLTTVVPFESKVIGQMLTRRVDEDVPRVRAMRPAISEGLDDLVDWLTQRERDARPASWQVFAVALAEKAAQAGVTFTPPAATRPAGPGPALEVEEFDPGGSDPGPLPALLPPTPAEALQLPGSTAPSGESGGADLLTFREPAIGEVLGDHRLDAVLGRGGMGVVYRATRLKTGKPVAVKVVVVSQGQEGERRRERFAREVEALRRLSHPNVVRVHAYGRKGAFDWYAMDLVDGRPLDALLADPEVRLSWHQKLSLFIGVCKAVAQAHEQKVIHRDLKPSNVLVDARLTPYVLDFGLAKITDETKQGLTRTGAFLGTPFYMAPEQFMDPTQVDARIDVFSLGVLLYELVVGARPFQGDTAGEISYKIMREDPPRPSRVDPKLDPAFDAVVLRALRKAPDQRTPSVERLKREVVQLRRGTAEADGALKRGWGYSLRWLRANRSGVLVGALLATVAYIPVVLLVYWLLL